MKSNTSNPMTPPSWVGSSAALGAVLFSLRRGEERAAGVQLLSKTYQSILAPSTRDPVAAVTRRLFPRQVGTQQS